MAPACLSRELSAQLYPRVEATICPRLDASAAGGAQHLGMSDDAAVRVKGLVKAYGGRRVVDGLDLEVAAGEIVGLIGANGAGKTTTVECVQGLRRPDRGTISVFGLDPREI